MSQIGFSSPVFLKAGKHPYFSGKAQQNLFLKRIQDMDPEAQAAMREIYKLAHREYGKPADSVIRGANHKTNTRPDPNGFHVIMAMVAGARHVEIYKITLFNILVRLGYKRSLRTGDLAKAQRQAEALKDFHTAMDIFMSPRWDAADERPPKDNAEQNGQGDGFSMSFEEYIVEVIQFKNRARPAITNAKK